MSEVAVRDVSVERRAIRIVEDSPTISTEAPTSATVNSTSV
jgi:hypothetical protein